MNQLTQNNIDVLDELASRFGCKLYMPPYSKNYKAPFFCYKDLKENVVDIRFITNVLLDNYFSFAFDCKGNLLILGTMDEQHDKISFKWGYVNREHYGQATYI